MLKLKQVGNTMTNPYCKQILTILQKVQEPLCVSEIYPQMKIKKNTFAQSYCSIALKKLKDVGVVECTKAGKFRFYEINQSRLDIIKQAENLLL